MGGLRIVVADDQPIRAEGVRDALEALGEVELVDTPMALMVLCEREEADVEVLSPAWLAASDVAVLRHLRTACRRVRILLFPYEDADAGLAEGAIRYGLQVLASSASPEQLATAVSKLARDECLPMPASLVRTLMPPIEGTALSTTERRIVAHARDLLKTAEIATAETIAISTVKTHFERIFKKLDVHSRAEAVQVATERGEITAGRTRRRSSADRAARLKRVDAAR